MRPLETITGYRLTGNLCEGVMVESCERFGEIAGIPK
jgi:hypothetical protein